MKIISRVLDNGLHVFLVPMPGTETLTTAFAVRAGWRYETGGVNEGTAHFLEHVLFKGSLKRPRPGEIAKTIAGVGGQHNAWTDPDNILFFIKTPADHAQLACDVLSDMIINPLLDPDEIEKEKTVVKQELDYDLSTPQACLQSIILPKLLFGDHPAGWTGIGTEQEIYRINRDGLIAYKDDLYVAPNAALCMAGKIKDTEALFDTINDYFSPMPSHKPRRINAPFFTTQTKPKVKLASWKAEQIFIAIALRGVCAHHPDREYLGVFNALLGEGPSSRLFLEIREQKGLAYDIVSDLNLQSDTGALIIFAGLSRERWREGLVSILNELRELKLSGPKEDELVVARESLAGGLIMALEGSHFVAQTTAGSWAILDKPKNLWQKIQKIRRVNADGVHQIARDLIDVRGLNIAVAGSHKSNEKEILSIIENANL